MHVNDLLHRGRFGEFDVVEEAASQKGVRQFLFVVGGDENERPVFGFDQFACFIAIKLHAIDFAQQIVGEFNVCFVDFVNQQGYGLV